MKSTKGSSSRGALEGRVTLADVASAAGVSAKTASLALLHGRGTRSTVETVKRAAKEMGFVSRKARHHSRILLVVTPLDSNPTYYGELIEQLMLLGASEGISVIHVPFHIHRTIDYDEVHSLLRGRLMAAVLVGAIATGPWHRMLARDAIPLVCAGTAFGNSNMPDIPRIQIGNEGIVSAVRHVVAAGRTHVGYIRGPAGSFSNSARQRAIEDALGEHGASLHANLIRDFAKSQDQFQAGYDACTSLLQSSPVPNTVFAYNDLMALGALSALAESKVPPFERPWIIGHDDLPFARFSTPALATIRVDRAELARMIFETVAHTDVEKSHPLVVQTHFELRTSAKGPEPDTGW